MDWVWEGSRGVGGVWDWMVFVDTGAKRGGAARAATTGRRRGKSLPGVAIVRCWRDDASAKGRKKKRQKEFEERDVER